MNWVYWDVSCNPKTMRELLELKTVIDNLKHLKDFIYQLETSISNVDQIINAQNDVVFLKPIEEFLGHYVYLVYTSCALNCYKIFHIDEKRAFLKLFNKIENCRYDNDFRELFLTNIDKADQLIESKEQLKELCGNLREEIKANTEIIEKISSRRTKVYAHSDPDSINFETETLKDLKNLRDLAKSIYLKLYGKLFDSHYMFEVNIFSIEPVINDRKFVANYYKDLKDKI